MLKTNLNKWIAICDELVNETNLKWCSYEWKIIDKIQYSELKINWIPIELKMWIISSNECEMKNWTKLNM